MKKRQFLRTFGIVCWLVVFACGSFLFSQDEPVNTQGAKVTYFSARSLYFYAMGSYHYFDPPNENYDELGPYAAGAFAPVFGAGYRLLNVNDSFFINFEVDYAPAVYDFGSYARDQAINAWTLMLDTEWQIRRRSPLSFTFGIGVGIFDMKNLGFTDAYGQYIATGSDTEAGVTIRVGTKIAISRNFKLRAEFRWTGKSYGDCYWDEWYDYCDYEEADFLASALCVGFELHLGRQAARPGGKR